MDVFIGMLSVVLFMAFVGERVVEAVVAPLFTRYLLDRFWLLYIAWAVCSILVFSTGVNLFAGYVQDAMLGQVLTALACGGGSNLIHELFDGVARGASAVHVDRRRADGGVRRG